MAVDNTSKNKTYLSQTHYSGIEPETKNFGDLFNVYGYEPDGKGLPSAYIVRIKSYRNHSIIRGVLQDNVQQRTESHWEPLVPRSLTNSADSLVQLGSGGRGSLISRITTRRKWTGTDPMVISFNLHFEAIKDPLKEVVLPCRELLKMALPGEGIDTYKKEVLGLEKFVRSLPLSSPPGPSPFEWWNLLNVESKNTLQRNHAVNVYYGNTGGDFIEVKIGDFQRFRNVIMKVPSVSFQNKYTKEGYPIAADVGLRFETYEMITKEALDEVFDNVGKNKYDFFGLSF